MRHFFILLLALILLLTACGKQSPPVTDLLADLLSLPGLTPPDADIYFMASTERSLGTVAKKLYGDYASALTHVEDYAILLGRSATLFEIHILRAADASHIPTLRRMLEWRAKLLCLATEEGHQTNRNAIVCVQGDLLYLFATPSNELLQSTILK